MAKPLHPPVQALFPERPTRLGRALARRLEERGLPVITNYDLFLEVRTLYLGGQKLYLRKDIPNRDDYIRVRHNLIHSNIILPDSDYLQRAYKIHMVNELPSEEICCIVDPFCYIAHLSAMQRFGLTERRSKNLMLTRPRGQILKEMTAQKLRTDYADLADLAADEIYALQGMSHPHRVRKTSIDVYETNHPGGWIHIRSSQARISTIGQTFMDMLEEPARCGGMPHVIDVWQNHVRIYLEEVVAAVEKSSSSIAKVRAGYLLDEVLKIRDPRVLSWRRHAQRGGSRRLDPSKPYAPRFSEAWMISINV